METLSLKDLHYKPTIPGYPTEEPETTESDDRNYSLTVSVSNPFDGLPENYFVWPEAQIVARYWTKECTEALEREIQAEGDEAWRSFKMQDVVGKDAYKPLLAELKEEKEKYEKEGLWIHGYTTPPTYFAQALVALINQKSQLVYEQKETRTITVPEVQKTTLPRQINPPLGDGQDLVSIKRCVACGTDLLLIGEERGGFLWLGKFTTISCGHCGAKFRKRIDGNGRWHFANIADAEAEKSKVWQEYHFEELTAREWVNIGNGGLSDQKQRVVDIENWLERLSEGTLRVSFKGVDTPILLKPDEELLFALPNVMLKEPRAVRKSSGGYAGPSFRITKGVYFRMGRFGSTSESHQEIRDIDRGILTVTGERLIFSGNMKTINIDLRKIVQVDPFLDGFALHKEGREKTQYFVWNENIGRMQLSEGDRKYTEPISGMIVKCVMEGAIRNYTKRRRT